MYKLGNIALEQNKHKGNNAENVNNAKNVNNVENVNNAENVNNDEDNIEIIEEETINIEAIVKDKLKGFRRTTPTTSSQARTDDQLYAEAATARSANNQPPVSQPQAQDARPQGDQAQDAQPQGARPGNDQQNDQQNGLGQRQPENQHQNTKVPPQSIKYCHYYNNGKCSFEEKSGRKCIFSHANAPACNFDGNCNRKKCMFSHPRQNQYNRNNQHFLGQRSYAPPNHQAKMFMEQIMGALLQGQTQTYSRWGQNGPRRNY